MNYDQLLETLTNSLDELAQAIETDVKKDFPDYGDWIDVYVGGLRALDRNDYFGLSGTLSYLGKQLHDAHSKCKCDNVRWHAVLGRIDTAFQEHAKRNNLVVLKLVCEERGYDYEAMKAEMDKGPVPLPEMNVSFEIPDYVPEEFK